MNILSQFFIVYFKNLIVFCLVFCARLKPDTPKEGTNFLHFLWHNSEKNDKIYVHMEIGLLQLWCGDSWVVTV